MRNTRFAIAAASAVMLLLGARFAAAQELSPEVAEELKPQVEAGARLLSDMSEEAQAYRRKELAKTVNPVMDPVPRKLKKQLYDQLSTISGMSMRQLFNFMTAKKKVAEGVEFVRVGLGRGRFGRRCAVSSVQKYID